MVKIINGRKYNTETARFVGGCSEKDNDELYPSKFELYRKRTGEYFLHSTFGYYNESITPLDNGDALYWAQKNLDVKTYEAEFGELVEDDSHVAMTLNLPKNTYDKLKRLALKNKMPASKYIGRMIDDIKEEME